MSNNSGLLVIALISIIVISLFGALTLTGSQVIDWTELTGIPANLAYYPITVNASCPETFPYANLTGVPSSFPSAWATLTGIPNLVINESINLFVGHINWAQINNIPSTFTPSSHTHIWTDIISGIPNFVINASTNLFMGQVYYNQVLNHPNSYPWANLTDVPSTFAPSQDYFSWYYNPNTDPQASPRYLSVQSWQTTETQTQIIIPIACRVVAIYLFTGTPETGAATYWIGLQVNGVSKDEISISSINTVLTVYSDTGSVSVNAGDKISFRLNGGSSTNHMWITSVSVLFDAS